MIAYMTSMENPNRKAHILPSSNKAVRKSKRQGWKKPKDAPKQPLSAYNLFYQHERQQILNGTFVAGTATTTTSTATTTTNAATAPVGFAPLTRCIANKWKTIDPETRQHFEKLAAVDKARYQQEKKAWRSKGEIQPAVASNASFVMVPFNPVIFSSFNGEQQHLQQQNIAQAPAVPLTTSIGGNDHNDNGGFLNHKIGTLAQEQLICDDDDENDDSSGSLMYSSDETSLESTNSQKILQPMAVDDDVDSFNYNNNYAMAFNNYVNVGYERDTGDAVVVSRQREDDATTASAFAATTAMMCPVPLTDLKYQTSIRQLASSLDDDSMDILRGLLD